MTTESKTRRKKCMADISGTLLSWTVNQNQFHSFE